MSEATETTVRCDCPPEAGSATCEQREQGRSGICPTCGERGKAVDTATVKALLAVPLTAVHAVDYLFCRTVDCPTVYFTVDGESLFSEDSLRERVHQKHPEDDNVFVCYCFRHTPGTIGAEISRTGGTSVVDAVTAGIRAGQCACDIRNPQGSCCLGNVRAVVDRLATALRATEPS